MAPHVGECSTDNNEDTHCNPGEPRITRSEVKNLASRIGESDAPDVVSLQSLGCCDLDLSNISTHDLMLYALSQVKQPGDEGGYAVRHGRRPVRDFGLPRQGEHVDVHTKNPLAAAYPCLWPYAEGGIEAERQVKVSFAAHVRWCLQYYDRRFATHHSFPFVVFGIEQKRQALKSARLQMQRRNFEADARTLSTITYHDMEKAQAEEDHGQRISDPRVHLLKKHMFATSSRVMGSDHMRAGYRSQIWSTSIFLNPPTLWTTWNFCDIHDPLVQVLAGENINMDAFIRTAGPSAEKRAQNVAKNPYAAAKFFHFVSATMLRTLFGIYTKGGRVISQKSILGHLNGYFGVVEAQGRGTLHLHMMMWLKNAPTADEMAALLKTESFRDQICQYIGANLRSHLSAMTSLQEIKAIPRESDLAYSRPPHPDASLFEQEMAELELRLVRSQQVHTCKTTTCLRFNRHGQVVCKRNAPWPLTTEDFVSPNGKWGSRRTYGFLNTWNPVVMPYLRCNHDIKLLTNGSETKDCGWYITCYQTKKQNKSHNRSALLSKAFAYHDLDTTYLDDIRQRNRLLIFRACNAINKEQELSAPQVVSYLMGWGDVYRSHQYVPLYWTSVVSALIKEYPLLRRTHMRR